MTMRALAYTIVSRTAMETSAPIASAACRMRGATRSMNVSMRMCMLRQVIAMAPANTDRIIRNSISSSAQLKGEPNR